MATDGLTTMRALAKIINESLDTVEAAYSKAGVKVPSLDAPFDPANPAEKVREEPAVATAFLNIMAATSQLGATVRAPAASVLDASQSFHIAACLRTASEINVVEILRDAGPQGLNVKDIAAPSKADPALLARILRLLATHNIFREVSPNVFANNRISSAIDKGKSPAALFANRQERLLGTNGLAALVEFFSEDIFKASAWLADTVLEPKEGQLPYNKAFGTDVPLYYYMQRPENLYRLQRFGLGMQGTAATEAPDAIFTGFEWDSLPSGAVLVDVGGGNGFSSMTIAQKHPKIKVVVQDLDQAIEGAKSLWKESFPTHVEKNLVEFQAHDFFKPQPVKDADVFFLRYIAHNWNDGLFVKILQNLRDVAKPSTKLIIVEKILSFATIAPATDIPGAAKPSAPAPLLPNWGVGTAEFYLYDVAVHNMLGGGERTLDGIRAWRSLRYNDEYAAKIQAKKEKAPITTKSRPNPFTPGASALDATPFGLGAQIFGNDAPLELAEPELDEESESDSDSDSEPLVVLAKSTSENSPWRSAPRFDPVYLSRDFEPDQPSTQSKLPAGVQMVDSLDDSGSTGDNDFTDMAEAYENTLHIDQVFDRFTKRVGLNSAQCLRYELEGTPLPYASDNVFETLFPPPASPSASERRVYSPTTLAACPICGAERVFECQLMPNLINLLRADTNNQPEPTVTMSDEERRKFVAQELKGGAGSSRGMNWGTCLVFSCSGDCCVDAEGQEARDVWREELVLVQWGV
ncbi:hypothetical protein HMN09_00906000 [Mycena chlorophos]|uniref:O-methyltransferase domain-containing protein n=1 Tax=Mycena chlorophos TaxID=658473 RepID=A0A8H6SQ50_MYCCL|nr:hypothetical protein HMN09_00906000 [Mycena chlorophos]